MASTAAILISMVAVEDKGVILGPRDNGWESLAVSNPGVIRSDNVNWMFYRAVDCDNVSRIGWAKINGAEILERGSEPLMEPEHDFEFKGLEDPRVVEVEGKFYMFYAAYDGESARMAYAVSNELPVFKKMGVISAELTYNEAGYILGGQNLDEKYTNFAKFHIDNQGSQAKLWQKDAFLFPRKFNGKYLMIHRVLPGIQLLEFEDFSELTPDFWRKELEKLSENILLDPVYTWESNNIGGGCPPIETADGWLLIYHAVEFSGGINVYTAGVALADLDNPRKIIGRLKKPLFSPTQVFEKTGVVPFVVFPSGALVENDDLWVYYGAADKVIGAKKISISQLLKALKS